MPNPSHGCDAQTPGQGGGRRTQAWWACAGSRACYALGQKCICRGTHQAPCPALPSGPPAPARPDLAPWPRGLEPIGEVEDHLSYPLGERAWGGREGAGAVRLQGESSLPAESEKMHLGPFSPLSGMASQLLGLGGVARDQACRKQEVRSARGWVSWPSAQAHRGAGAGGGEVGRPCPQDLPGWSLPLLKTLI